MEEKKIIIIGAGVAGLSVGSYLQMNGYHTEIFEMHTLPGGLCTSWNKQDYTIDGCIHWLVGSSPADPMYKYWNELVDMKSISFVDHDIYISVEDGQGNVIHVYSDAGRLEKELLTKAPEDADFIKSYCRSIRRLTHFNSDAGKAEELYTFLDKMKMGFRVLPYLGDFMKWSRTMTKDLLPKIKNPLLRKTLRYMFIPEMSIIFLVFTGVWMHKKSGGYPIGGSLAFSKRLEDRYLSLGGKIHYGQKVVKIHTTNKDGVDHPESIELMTGERHQGDIIISAADGHYTIFEMLGGQFVDKTIQGYYDHYLPFSSYLQVSYGVARSFSEDLHLVVIPSVPPVMIDPVTTMEDISVRVLNFDPTLAPEGKTVITVMIPTYNHQYWVDLKKTDLEKYKEEKNRIAGEILNRLEGRFGPLQSKVEMTDVSTPATVIRYTNNWQGSFEGWVLTPEMGFRSLKKTLPGLDNFYMVGQWVVPGGGVPSGLISGRGMAQIICKKDGKKFMTISF
jgi:phytoene dehydrogenase-like protein